MSLRLAHPQLADFVYVANRLRHDERMQFEAMAGVPYNADMCARAGAGMTGPAYSYLTQASIPVLIGGFEPIRPGVYEAWHMATADGWERHWRSFHKVSVRLMDNLFEKGAHRIQVASILSRTAALEWYGRIGMMKEGILTGYCTDGQDAALFARTERKQQHV